MSKYLLYIVEWLPLKTSFLRSFTRVLDKGEFCHWGFAWGMSECVVGEVQGFGLPIQNATSVKISMERNPKWKSFRSIQQAHTWTHWRTTPGLFSSKAACGRVLASLRIRISVRTPAHKERWPRGSSREGWSRTQRQGPPPANTT